MATPPASYGYPQAAITADKLPLWQQPLSRFSVAGPADWKVSSLASIDRGIRVEAGTGSGDAVTDVIADYETLSLPSPPIPSAWYLIVRRRNWTSPGTSTLVPIRGTATKALPKRSDSPGAESDQPLALVRVTQKDTTVQEIVDLRCWASNGGVEIVDALALDYLGTPGARVKLGKTLWTYEAQANGVWGWGSGESGWVDLTLGSTPGVPNVRHAGWWVRTGGGLVQARLTTGGTTLQIRCEAAYVNTGTPSYLPAKGWVVATLPPHLRPSSDCFVVGTTGTYQEPAVYVVKANGDIAIASKFTGKIAQFLGAVPL